MHLAFGRDARKISNFIVSFQRDENNSKFDTVDNDNRPPFIIESTLNAGGPPTTMINCSETGKLSLEQIMLLMIVSVDFVRAGNN